MGAVHATVTGNSRGVALTPDPIPPAGETTGSEVIDGPAANEELSATVTVDIAGATSEASVTVTAATCTGPAAPEDITFTFSNDANVATASVGETVAYTYCSRNTSDVDVEVIQVVDDRHGIVQLPDGGTIVSPGETICNTDLGVAVTHVATSAEEGTSIVNNAVVTVRTVQAEPRQFQATDFAEVEILGLQAPEQAPTTTELPETPLADTGASSIPAHLFLAALALASGLVLLVIGTRRANT